MTDTTSFFEFSNYHIVLTGCGVLIVLAYWIPQFISKRTPAASGLLILGGLLSFLLLPDWARTLSPTNQPDTWRLISEIAVIIALFGTGIRIDNITGIKRWSPTIRLLAITMPLCILTITLLGVFAGFGLGVAILLAAVLAPTDPVLAADVQLEPPQEGKECAVKYTLTTEAGLNDGLAFPFVYLGILLVANQFDVGEWIGIYIVYKIIVGIIIGCFAGWLLGKILFVIPKSNLLANSGSGLIALAGVLFTYGACELAEGYGFIAVFLMGLVLRREEKNHKYHKELHTFSDSIEQAITALMLIFIGYVLPVLWETIDWKLMGIGIALLIIRPLAGMISLSNSELNFKHRALISFYGIRGIGSVFYLAYAAEQVDLIDADILWSTTATVILISTVIHGFTANIFVKGSRV